MKIYIASSWKNQHAVELLTAEFRRRGHEVASFVEKADNFEELVKEGKQDFDDWVNSDHGGEKFQYDTSRAMSADLLVYISPSGTDAWAEVGAAWARGVNIVGLYAKGEQAGLMRRMVTCWVNSVGELLEVIDGTKKCQPT